MIKFNYLEPATIKKALALLGKHGDDARVIAGGTSLLIMMRQRLLMPRLLRDWLALFNRLDGNDLGETGLVTVATAASA